MIQPLVCRRFLFTTTTSICQALIRGRGWKGSFLKLSPCSSSSHRFVSSKGTSVSSLIFQESKNKSSQLQHYRQDNPRQEQEESQKLMQQISNLKSATDLAIFLETASLGCLDERDLNSLFSASFNVVRHEKSEKSRKELLNSVGMQKVFKLVKKYCRWVNPGELITILKLMTFLNTSGSHTTLQIVLRLLSKQANSLTLPEIVYTSYLLERVNPSPIVTALQMALPIVFESSISSKLDISDGNQLSEALHYGVRHNLSDDKIQLIIDALITNINILTPKQSMSVVWSLADLKRRLMRQELLVTPLLKNITDSFDQFTPEEHNTTIIKLSKKYNRNANYFYNEDFVGKFCQSLTELDHAPETVLHSTKAMWALKHVDIAFLDRVSEIILSDPSILLNNDLLLCNILRAFSSANYKPETWDTLEPILLNHPFLTKEVDFHSIPLAVDFLALDSFPINLISKIFSPQSFSLLEQFVKQTSPYMPLLILKSIKFLHPEYSGTLPPSSIIELWEKTFHKIPKSYPLKSALETGIGGSNYVVSGLFHEGFHLDHAIVYRKGGYPIALDNTGPIGLNELQLHSESVVVMVKALLPDAYSTNTNRLRGIYALELKLIESLGYSVIVVDIARWKDFLDVEKIPFLMHRIREKLDSPQWN